MAIVDGKKESITRRQRLHLDNDEGNIIEINKSVCDKREMQSQMLLRKTFWRLEIQ